MSRQIRILYADDEDALRDLLRDHMVGLGYVFDEAKDGAEAIEKVQKETYDIILLDINMPRKSGVEVLRYIKENKLPGKVIMLTGRVGFSVGTETMEIGADDYITKPFDLDYLKFAIERALA